MHKRLAFIIHDLNHWGGQDRSTLEIARRLSHLHPVDIFAFTLDDKDGDWGDVHFHRIRPLIKRPVILKSTYFYGASFFSLLQERPLVHATGACSLMSDVIQVQFVNASWQKKLSQLPAEFRAPGLKAYYHKILLAYNVAVERSVYTP